MGYPAELGKSDYQRIRWLHLTEGLKKTHADEVKNMTIGHRAYFSYYVKLIWIVNFLIN